MIADALLRHAATQAATQDIVLLNTAGTAADSTSMGFYGLDSWGIQPGDLLLMLSVTKDGYMVPADAGWVQVHATGGRSVYQKLADGTEASLTTVPDTNTGRVGALYHMRGASGVAGIGVVAGTNPPGLSMAATSLAIAANASLYYGIAATTAPTGYGLDRRPTGGSGYSRVAICTAHKVSAPDAVENPAAFSGASGNDQFAYTIEVAAA